MLLSLIFTHEETKFYKNLRAFLICIAVAHFEPHYTQLPSPALLHPTTNEHRIQLSKQYL